jgi:hypothetical protein
MPDNPMVGYAYQYRPNCVERVKRWAFVHWATAAFDGFGQCVRYEVRLVLPIMDSDGRVYRLLRKPEQWADPSAFKSTISEPARAKAEADLQREIGRVYAANRLNDWR